MITPNAPDLAVSLPEHTLGMGKTLKSTKTKPPEDISLAVRTRMIEPN